MTYFIGRKKELTRLKALDSLEFPKLVVIKGRRRIGKSRLVEEFGKDRIFISFSGLPPLHTLKDQDQKDAFAQQISQRFHTPPFFFRDWSDGLRHVTQHLTQAPTVLLLDEISWMGSKDSTFVPKLKVWWDLVLKDYPRLTLVFCGSVSPWIEENIINSTAFFGRIALQITLEELSLKESYQFLQALGVKASHYDIFKILSITGGVPWYLMQINPQTTIDENIKRLCFEPDGHFVQEFRKIFHDLFGSSGEIYKKIIHHLADGMKDLRTLRELLNYAKSGTLSHYLHILTLCGFVTPHYNWSLKTGKMRKGTLYRLSDNYIRFFLKYIEPNLLKINQHTYQDLPISSLPGWESIMGYQVENLILKNRHLLFSCLNIPPQDIVADNPYFQNPTTRHKGCQIDYLIQTRTNNLFVCECKFKKKEISTDIISSMKEKITRFSIPKGYGICPVLIHLGGIADTVYDTKYFYRIMDIEQFLIEAN